MEQLNAQRVSPSPQELVDWLRSTDLDNTDGNSTLIGGGGMFGDGNTGLVSPELDNMNFARTRMNDIGSFTAQQLHQSRLPFMHDVEHRRRASPAEDGNDTYNCNSSPRDVASSYCFIRALERSQQSQYEIDRFDSDDYRSGGRRSFNAALMTTRSRRMLLASARDIIHNDPPNYHHGNGVNDNTVVIGEDLHGVSDNTVVIGENLHASSPSPLSQDGHDWNYDYDGQHHHQENQRQLRSMSLGCRRSNRVDSWTHLDMLNMLRTMVDDEYETAVTRMARDTNMSEPKRWRRSDGCTGVLHSEDAVRAELHRLAREQLEWEEAQLGL